MTSRRRAAILAADVFGYSRMIGAGEASTLAWLQALRRDVIDPAMARIGGRLVKDTGDGVFAEFASAVEADSTLIWRNFRCSGQDSDRHFVMI